MTWVEHQLERLRSINPHMVDGALALALLFVGTVSVFAQEVIGGLSEPPGLAHLTVALVTLPVVIRRSRPLLAMAIASAAVLAHVVADWPEGSLPMSALLLAYSVGAWEPPRRAAIGLGIVYLTLVTLGVTDTPGLDTLGVVGNLALFTVAWTVGVAVRARRDMTEARVRTAEEEANVERQSAARAIAEERLRIAQELHDVVAHSMSVIAVQAGVGAHVLDERPDQARAALEAISATSRGTLTEMRRLLGVLRGTDGERSDAPAPALVDLPALVEDVRSAGVPVTLTWASDGAESGSATTGVTHPGVELSAYRVVQEALTNVMKHAGATSRVEVIVRDAPDGLEIEVVDDGRGAAAGRGPGGHGLLGMRERVELWGGELSAGPAEGGGYRVRARLPLGTSS